MGTGEFNAGGSPGGYPHITPIRVYAAQRGRDIGTHDLDRSI